MIRIIKPATAPKILNEQGRRKTAALKANHTKYPEQYESGARLFTFDGKIYGHESVKEALIAAQHDKCCFCESKITHISYGDVEHFRPKAGHCQDAGDDLRRPGYYWLAYSWENLFLSCQLCNQRYKKNVFPLIDPRSRALSHNHDLTLEQPLFIDPGNEDPEQFISFREEIPFPIDDNTRGQAAIEHLGLKRPKLAEVRYDHYQKLKMVYELLLLVEDAPEYAETIRDAKSILAEAVEPSAEFAAMARSAIGNGFRPFAIDSHIPENSD
ncbi:MAG TPA: hypothetical protein VI756_04160 [Blastocatellia bacterium]